MSSMPASWIAQPPRGPDVWPAKRPSAWSKTSISGRSAALGTVRPLFKYSWPDGQQVYVNGNTGEVVQYTTTASRVLGVSRRNSALALLHAAAEAPGGMVLVRGLVVAHRHDHVAAGLVIIVWMYSPRKRYRYAGAPTSIPYRGWKRWHAIVGLFFGVVATTWAFSGLLSMGPFPIMNRLTELTVPAPAEAGGRRGGGPSLNGAAARRPRAAAVRLRGASAGRCDCRRCRLRSQRARVDVLCRGAVLSRSEWPRRDARDSDAGRSEAEARSGGSDARRARRDRRRTRRAADHRSIRRVLPGSPSRASASRDLRAPERRRRHPLLHRSENRDAWWASTARAAG